MTSQGGVEGQNILLVLAPICFLWNNLWSVCRFITGPISGCSSQNGTSQQHLTAPIRKCMSGIDDHRFTFLMDLLSNYTFYTNLTNLLHYEIVYKRCDKPDSVQFTKSWENYATSFDAGLIYSAVHSCIDKNNKTPLKGQLPPTTEKTFVLHFSCFYHL